MKRRTTLEIESSLLTRAQRVLGLRTMRDTIEEALRLVIQTRGASSEIQKQRQRDFLSNIAEHSDLEVLTSDEMWR